MVVFAQPDQVRQVGQTAVFPLDDVVDDHEVGVFTTRVATLSVSAPGLSSLGLGSKTLGPAFEHRVTVFVIEGHGDVGPTADALGCLGTDEPEALQLGHTGAVGGA